MIERRLLIEEYADGQARMRRLRDGTALRYAAKHVLKNLPGGRLTLVATSLEGLALAAACAALRDSETAWARIDLGSPRPAIAADNVVVVEPVDGGAGWRKAVEAHFPGASIVVADVPPRALAA